MARILFFMRCPLDGRDNLAPKFEGQMAAARALGHEALCLKWNRQGFWRCGEGEPALVKPCRFAGVPGYAHTLLYIDLMAALRRLLARERFDLIYMRFMPTFGNAVGALKAARRGGARLVVEHPTYPFGHGKTTSLLRRPAFWYTERVFARIHPLVDLYTLIGDDGGGALEGKPAMNIVNGVDASAFPLHAPRPDDPGVHLLALASMSRWQGYDRLLRAMAGTDEDVTLHMAGGEGDGSLAEWKRLARELGLEARVRFEGECYGERLNALIAGCDAGVGGLGLYRKGQYRSMTLKLREYMARGLPFLYAVEDPSIPREPRFSLKLPNDDSVPDFRAILAFARRVKRDAEAPALMRAYAEKNMSWTGVMKPVLERVGIPCQEPSST